MKFSEVMSVAAILGVTSISGSPLFAQDELNTYSMDQEIRSYVDAGALILNEETGRIELSMSLADILRSNGEIERGQEKEGNDCEFGPGKGR